MERALRIAKSYIPRSIFIFFQPAYHYFLAFIAAIWYWFPGRGLTVIGVTGTKGKTTVVELLHAVLEESGAKTASLSSLRFRIGADERPNELKMTMPGRFFVQKFLRDAKKAGCSYAVLEVTSQGIAQFRHRGIPFHVAVMTNVAPEHIEAHGNFEKYLRAKLDLFWRLPASGIAVINQDDPRAQRFFAATRAHIIRYGKEGITKNSTRLSLRDIRITGQGISCECDGLAIASLLLGEFNLYNILAAAAVGVGAHIARERIAAGIARVSGIPGRMEYLGRAPFAVVVDYAHTPDSLRNVYAFLARTSKLICVLGAAGGGRDQWKRPEFGKIAAEFCDKIILTNEDPYDEDPARILSEIKSGIPGNRLSVTREILDRREAIRAALHLASPGDTVVITGKGAEPWIMGPAGEKIAWDDRAVAREELKNLP